MKAGAVAAAAGYFNNVAMDATSAKAAVDAKMLVTEADAELRNKVTEFVEADLPTVRSQLSDSFGISNVDEKIATVRELIEKWKGLTNQPDMTKEQLAHLYWDEVFSKVDPATYGMN